MKKATFVKKLSNFRGEANLYKCSPALDGHIYVVVSAITAPYSGPETYIFPSNKKGEITDWGELNGSFRGGLNHERALANAGYEVTA